MISNGMIIILIIVMWLFVLAPLLVRSQRPLSKTGEAFEDTRVLYEGGSGKPPARRQPRLRSSDVHRPNAEENYEVVAAEAVDGRDHEVEFVDELEPVLEGELIEDAEMEQRPAADGSDEGPAGSTAVSALQQDSDVEQLPVDNGGTYDYDDSYVGAGDVLHHAARHDAAEEWAAPASDAPQDTAEDVELVDEAELTDEEVAFARRRSARGGWDPVADEARTLDRYSRRRRTLGVLAALLLVFVVVGFVGGSWFWLPAAVVGTATAVYLLALRNQVRQEQELRARRIRHLRRARLGVRQSAAPDALRRPGGVVLRVDDDSPDFDYLPEYRFDDAFDGSDGPAHEQDLYARRRSFSRAS